MASETRIVFNSDGFRQILFSDGVKQAIETQAEEIADRANAAGDCNGFKPSVIAGGYGGGRYIGFVSTTDKKSMQAESENKALTGAIL